MYEIVNCYRQSLPACRFIGIRYGDTDRIHGGFGAKWDEYFVNGRFIVLEALADDKFKNAYSDHDAYAGLMRWKEGEPFQYWIGMFLAAGTPAPEGYGQVDLPKGHAGICWLKGRTEDIFGKEMACLDRLAAEGFKEKTAGDGASLFFERYACPRYTTPAADGTVILDIGWFIQ